jgi:hypothetical protein
MAAVLVFAVALTFPLFVFPSTGPVGSVDAVIILAGDAPTRLPVATRLAEEGEGVLVVSVAEGEDNEPARILCDRPGNLTVHCFDSAGSDTRSEAQEVGRIVADQEWTRIAVVTNSYHVVRAGVLVRRCTEAEVRMVDARGHMPARRWVFAIAGEVGGLAESAVRHSC